LRNFECVVRYLNSGPVGGQVSWIGTKCHVANFNWPRQEATFEFVIACLKLLMLLALLFVIL
jgi:hypothetical protein